MKTKTFTEWSYVNLTIAAFVFAPEVRRLADWRSGSSAISIFSALPTLMLIPIAFMAYRRRAAIARSPFFKPVVVWTIGFLYAFVIATASNFITSGLYGLGVFLLPAALGAWFATSKEPLAVQYERISSALFLYGAIAGVYGIIQYVTAPPWDTAWMEAIKADSFGQPVKFGIRVFSVMNGPGIYAEFTACSLIISFPNMRPRRPWTIVATVIMCVGLALSLVRSAWLGLAIGAVVFALISPRRKQALLSLLTVALIFIASAAAFFTFVPNEQLQTTLVDRLSSLGNVSEDASAQAREDTSRVALDAAIANPLGQGLGLTGQTATLSQGLSRTAVPAESIDNGFVSRFLEMGVFGFTAFLIAIFWTFLVSWQRLQDYVRRKDQAGATTVAALFSAQVAIFLIGASGDVYSGVGSVLFFIAFGLATNVVAEAPLVPPMPVASGKTRMKRGSVKAPQRFRRSTNF